MASMKRELWRSDEPDAKKAKVDAGPFSQRVVLNPADCDLDFNVEGNGLQGSALYEQGFAYCWSGARANKGITGGKYCFGCKIVSEQPVDVEDIPLDQQHVCRIGISRGEDTVGKLGETLHSYGFGGTGKFSNQGMFSEYGERFGVGDTIICCVDLESSPLASISFSKNRKCLGIAKRFNAGPSVLFPHVLLKNVVVHMQFSVDDGLVPVEGYKPWSCATEDRKTVAGPSFPNLCDCEVMMMVGLPASGKSTWAEKWATQHPEKRYVLLGTNLALDLMKVPGLLRKSNYGERFERLMDRATGIFNTLLSRASRIPRNFIIDQTNVYKNARKRKLKPFANYKKIAVVIVPTHEELKLRGEKRFKEMGKEVPAEAVNEMLANFVLPMSKDMPRADEYFDEVWFEELGRVEAQRCLDAMKENVSLRREVTPYSREGSRYGTSMQVSHSGFSSQFLRNSPGGHQDSSFQELPYGEFGQHTYGNSRGYYEMEARSAIHGGGFYEPRVDSGAESRMSCDLPSDLRGPAFGSRMPAPYEFPHGVPAPRPAPFGNAPQHPGPPRPRYY